ncbi:MAG: hypothetical protein K0Q85_809 [Caproiciproducens sp.]|nr:hypothetical protein [Caproiciproducens sp.]
MKYSLKLKLTLSYALVALLLVASVSLISNIFLRNQFEQYIIRQQESKNEEVVSQIVQQYKKDAKEFPVQALETVGVSALERGMIVKVSNSSGASLWDATVHNNGLCHQMLSDMANNMQSRSPNFKGSYEEKSYPLLISGVKEGTVSIGYYGPFYYSNNDAEFINTLNRMLVAVGIVSLMLAILIGIYMASRISSPIAKAIGAAENIANGNYNDKIKITSNTLELNKLIQSINSLSFELENQESLRKRLTADIAHELRTPLAALQGNVEALIDGVYLPSTERFESCHEEILRLTRLVADLERLAQLEDENTVLNKSTVDLKELSEKVLKSFEAELFRKQIKASVSEESVLLTADSDKLRRVFVNLISNSLKYTPDGGRIDIKLSKLKDTVKIDLSDNGTGISKEDLPFIFERFYRTDKSRNSQSGGAGIGLAIVKKIIEIHKGQISVESEIGRGTRFVIVLPIQ